MTVLTDTHIANSEALAKVPEYGYLGVTCTETFAGVLTALRELQRQISPLVLLEAQ